MICAFLTYGKMMSETESLCSQNCPLECNSIEYSTVLSSSDYPTKYQMNKLSLKYPEISTEDLKSRAVSFRVYYKELKYIEISQVFQTNIWDMVTSIGGALGLFLGGSVISLLEIVYGFADICRTIIHKYLLKR